MTKPVPPHDPNLLPKIVDTEQFQAKPVEMEGVKDATIREVITEADGAPNFAMRIFEVEVGGHTPLHTHDYEHEIYILGGQGQMETAEGPQDLAQGNALGVPRPLAELPLAIEQTHGGDQADSESPLRGMD